MSMDPILFTQTPPVDTMVSKLLSSLESICWPRSLESTPDEIKDTISKSFGPYLKARISIAKGSSTDGKATSAALVSSTPSMLNSWTVATSAIISVFPVDALFPLIDMWRVSFLDPATCLWACSGSGSRCGGLIDVIASRALEVLETGEISKGRRNYVVTVLRLLCNTFSNAVLTRSILTDDRLRPILTGVLVQSLLWEDGSVRTAASSMAFNVAAWLQKGRVRDGREEDQDQDEEWEMELISAVVEGLGREKYNEEVGEWDLAEELFYHYDSGFSDGFI